MRSGPARLPKRKSMARMAPLSRRCFPRSLGNFLVLGWFSLPLRFGMSDHLLGDLVGDKIVMRELHAITGTPLGHRGEVRGIAEHLCKGHERLYYHVGPPRFAPIDPASPRAEIAHDVPRILVRGVHLHVHDWLEQRRPGCLHGLLESQGARNLERHVRGIYVMVFPVIEHGAEINHRIASQIPSIGRSANTLLHRGDVVLGNGPAEDIIHELKSCAARQRFHPHAADAELAMTASLLLVLTFRVSLGAYALAIRNFRGPERHVHLEPVA